MATLALHFTELSAGRPLAQPDAPSTTVHRLSTD